MGADRGGAMVQQGDFRGMKQNEQEEKNGGPWAN